MVWFHLVHVSVHGPTWRWIKAVGGLIYTNRIGNWFYYVYMIWSTYLRAVQNTLCHLQHLVLLPVVPTDLWFILNVGSKSARGIRLNYWLIGSKISDTCRSISILPIFALIQLGSSFICMVYITNILSFIHNWYQPMFLFPQFLQQRTFWEKH